jgi:hypothetical protein
MRQVAVKWSTEYGGRVASGGSGGWRNKLAVAVAGIIAGVSAGKEGDMERSGQI